MTVDSSEVLRTLDGLAFIRELFPEAPLPDQAGEVRFRCPFHADGAHGAAQFNVESKLFKCWNCNAGGSAVDLLAQVTSKPRHVAAEYLARKLGVPEAGGIASALVEEWHAALRQNLLILQELERRKGLDVASVERWRLGWIPKEKRLTIPIRDESGTVVNVRRYDLLKVFDEKQKYLNQSGHGKLRLFPPEALREPEVVITEGELKMIGLAQRGVNAITTTGGASGWKDEWDALFAGKRVAICYDVDDTGVARARALARRLHDKAVEVRVLALPLDRAKHPHGDVLDYFTREGYSTQDFRNLLLGTPPFQPEARVDPGLRDDLEYEVELGAASKAQYYHRKLTIPVIVSAKDTAPYIVPKDVRVDCSRSLEICAGCPVFAQKEDATWTFPKDDPDLLALIEVTSKNQDRAVREFIGIPERCAASDVVVLDTHNLEEVRLVPQLSTSGDAGGGEQPVLKAYYVGHGVETNATYRVKARGAVDPRDQHAVLLLPEATPNVDSLTSFAPGDAELAELDLFRPAEWTTAGIDAKFEDLYGDLEANVTRIFQRRALHVAMDLVWHSALYVTPFGEPAKGWVDALVIGDSGQGKSETAARLLRHYGVGDKVDMKGASVAGLKGGLQDTQNRWFVTWGAIPISDRRLVVLEEVKGAPVEVLQALTDMRSSGVAELTKIERRRAYARTRLLWLSNPRSDRRIETYDFGVLAVKELMGSLEDVRRFDLALAVASNEVDRAVINRVAPFGAVPHRHPAELCRRLVLWAWSRHAAQVEYEPDAARACAALAVDQSTKFSPGVPLVEPADHRLKLARLAAALAARTFSTSEDRQRLVVRECHVRWVAAFLDAIYSSKYMAYDLYSRVQQMDAELTAQGAIREALLAVPFAAELTRGLLRGGDIQLVDLMDFAGLEKETAKHLLSLLVRNNALQRRKGGYYKTGAFIEFLRNLKVDSSVPEHLRERLETGGF